MGGLPLLWSLSKRIAGAAGIDSGKEGEMWHSVVFGMIFYAKELLESLPWCLDPLLPASPPILNPTLFEEEINSLVVRIGCR